MRSHNESHAETEFWLTYEQFGSCVEDAVRFSETRMGVYHTGRQNRALTTYTKAITHCISMVAIIRAFERSSRGTRLLDHFSIGALGRVVLDAMLMTMYISELSLTRDQWDLRRHLLFLHDLNNRKRFMSHLKPSGGSVDTKFINSYPSAKARIIAKIKKIGKELEYPNAEIDKFTQGQLVFTGGVQGAVREAGWNVPLYAFYQTYLSNQIHSHPVSFLRAEEHDISFQEPSPFQLDFVKTVFDAIIPYLEETINRMKKFTGSASYDPVGQLD